MSDAAPPAPAAGEPVDWTEAGPVSPRFGDVYFSAADGLAESRAVFLEGCGLPAAWAGRRRFTVAELGFGTGLNILALLELWTRARPSPQARLSILSVEAYPLSPQDAARALARWPELSELAAPLLARWPRGRRGLHRFAWPALGAVLDLRIDEAEAALSGWDGRADAWFLDGFAPSRNPQMWREAVLAQVARCSAPGARAATFTVAGAVRRGLEAQGFAVEKRPGFGRKKERLEARARGAALTEVPPPAVAVIGAGIAGAALVRALQAQGARVLLVEAEGPGAGASGNAAALVTPRLDAGGGLVARLHAEAFAYAAALYEDAAPGAILARGALQLERTPRDAARFAKVAAFEGFDPGAVQLLDASDAAQRLEESAAPAGLLLRDGLVVEPASLLPRWLSGAGPAAGRVERLERAGGAWRLLDAAGSVLAEADAVVVATGAAAPALLPALPVRPVRGQASMAELSFAGAPAAWGGYAIPTRSGVLFGASHLPGDAATDARAEEAAGNQERLAQRRPALAAAVAALPAPARAERASLRAAAADHLPVAGAVGEGKGLYVLGALGARGYTLAPLLAEHVAAQVCGAASPLSLDLQAAVSPSRPALAGRSQEPHPAGPVPPAPGRPAPLPEP